MIFCGNSIRKYESKPNFRKFPMRNPITMNKPLSNCESQTSAWRPPSAAMAELPKIAGGMEKMNLARHPKGGISTKLWLNRPWKTTIWGDLTIKNGGFDHQIWPWKMGGMLKTITPSDASRHVVTHQTWGSWVALSWPWKMRLQRCWKGWISPSHCGYCPKGDVFNEF